MTPFASSQPPQSHMLIFPLHKSLLTDDFASPQNLAYSSSHTDSADSNSVFAWELSWVMLSTFPASRKAADPQENCVWAETTQSQMSGW